MPFLQSGQLRALAIAARQRHPALPDVPTFAEAGLPGVDAEAWFAVFGPARLPELLVGQLAAEISAITKISKVVGSRFMLIPKKTRKGMV
jgi:tripartite-type tricarboxylate transporter receptor subunit TctC